MKKILNKTKSNKAFTMQDLIIAFTILLLFTGLICGTIATIYKVQAETKLTSLATLYGIQIMENIDKISYDEVQNGDLRNWKNDYGIPDNMSLNLEVEPYGEKDVVKHVKLTISYELSGKENNLELEKFKEKES